MKPTTEILNTFSSENTRGTDSAIDGTVILRIQVVPGASRNEIVKVENETVMVRVTAPPVKGKANKAVVKLLARTLGLKKGQVEIVTGRTSRHKKVKVEGADEQAMFDLLRQSNG